VHPVGVICGRSFRLSGWSGWNLFGRNRFGSSQRANFSVERYEGAFGAALRRRWTRIRRSVPSSRTPTGLELPRLALPQTDEPGAIAEYLLRGLTVTLDGRPAAAEVGALEPGYEQGAPARVALTLRFSSPRPIETLRCRIAFFSDLTRQHRAVVTVRWGGGVRQLVRLGPSELELRGADLGLGRAAVVREFLLWGTEHIFLGYDHIAFLLALLLVAAGWTELLKIVTSFTVAHSLTLLLSALDVVRIPPRLTEILIAASIVYVAAENLILLARRRQPRQRWALTFGFGLVHGLRFSAAT